MARHVNHAALPRVPDSLFTLPGYILADPAAEHIREMHHAFMVNLRAEVEAKNLSVLTYMLLERVIVNYAILKWREGRPLGQEGGFEHTTAQKDFNNFWLGCLKELHAQFKAADSELDVAAARRTARIINQTLDGMHPDVAAGLRERFARAFEDAGL